MNAVRDAASARLRALTVAGLLLLGACGEDPLDPDPRCADAARLPFGQTVSGRLEPGDASFDRSFIDYYSVRPGTAGTLRIEMAAELPATGQPGVDPYLYIWTSDLGEPFDDAYDPTGAGPLRTARLVAEVSADCYRIGASGWPSDDRGEYTIRADFLPAP